MNRVVWGLVIALGILHYDFWWWDDRTILFGFLPVGLAFHAAFSLACGATWWLAVKYAWPDHVEAWAERGSEGGGEGEHTAE